jgi:hypothetical protein
MVPNCTGQAIVSRHLRIMTVRDFAMREGGRLAPFPISA